MRFSKELDGGMPYRGYGGAGVYTEEHSPQRADPREAYEQEAVFVGGSTPLHPSSKAKLRSANVSVAGDGPSFVRL